MLGFISSPKVYNWKSQNFEGFFKILKIWNLVWKIMKFTKNYEKFTKNFLIILNKSKKKYKNCELPEKVSNLSFKMKKQKM